MGVIKNEIDIRNMKETINGRIDNVSSSLYERAIVETVRGVWSSSSGDFVENNDYIASKEHIAVSPNTMLEFDIAISSSDIIVLFYDKSKNYLGNQSSSGNSVSIKLPNNVYYVNVDIQTTSNFNLSIKRTTFSKPIAEINDSLNVQNLQLLYTDGYTDNSYLDSSGNEVHNDTLIISKYVELGSVTSVDVSGTSSYNSSALCFYTANKTFIYGEKYGNRSSFSVDVPSNAVYVRYTLPKATEDLNNISITGKTLTKSVREIKAALSELINTLKDKSVID